MDKLKLNFRIGYHSAAGVPAERRNVKTEDMLNTTMEVADMVKYSNFFKIGQN